MSLLSPLRTRKQKPDSPEQPATTTNSLDIRALHEHLLVNSAGTWAWFLLEDVSWLCIDDDKSTGAMSAYAHRLASLAPGRIKWRITSSPFDYHAWARDLDEERPAPSEEEASQPRIPGSKTRLPDREGGDSFDDMLARTQLRQAEMNARNHAVAVGVLLTPNRLKEHALAKILSPLRLDASDGDLEAIRSELTSITVELAKEGLRGRPLDKVELAWLFHTSAGMGARVEPALLRGNATRYWNSQADGIDALVRCEHTPYGRTTVVHASRGGEEITNHVGVMAAVAFRDRDLDDRSLMPFLAWAQTRPYGVEVMADFRLVEGRDKKQEVQRIRRRARSIQSDYHDFNEDPPAEVERGLRRAGEMVDEVTNGDRVMKVRAEGWIFMAVTGETEQEVTDRCKDLIAAADEEQGITLIKPAKAQYAMYRAFVPSEPLPVTKGLDTQMNLAMLACGVPHASTSAGDDRGMYVGPVSGSHGIFLLDMFGGSRSNQSNVIAWIADQGGGKSSAGGALLAEAARLGIRSVGNDPSGMWLKLCDVPSLRADARHLDLFDCKPGTLTPSLMVPEPNREHFDTVDEYEIAVRQSEQTRLSATIDALRNLLPNQLISPTSPYAGDTVAALREAVSEAGGHYGADPWQAIDWLLRQDGELAPRLGRMLTTSAGLSGGRLILGDRRTETDDDYVDALMEQATLTIVTMKGISAGAKGQEDRSNWNEDQLQAVALLDLAALFSTRVIYSDKREKVVLNDELDRTGGDGSGAFGKTFSHNLTDSRKWNALIGLLGQNPSMFYKLNPEIANLLGQVWVGRLKKSVAAAALPLLDLPAGYRFEEIITHLETGQFLVRDWQGRHPIVNVDQTTWDPAVYDALDTNPQGRNGRGGGRRLGVAV